MLVHWWVKSLVGEGGGRRVIYCFLHILDYLDQFKEIKENLLRGVGHLDPLRAPTYLRLSQKPKFVVVFFKPPLSKSSYRFQVGTTSMSLLPCAFLYSPLYISAPPWVCFFPNLSSAVLSVFLCYPVSCAFRCSPLFLFLFPSPLMLCVAPSPHDDVCFHIPPSPRISLSPPSVSKVINVVREVVNVVSEWSMLWPKQGSPLQERTEQNSPEIPVSYISHAYCLRT